MDMIKARNLTSHTYNLDVAKQISSDILQRFHPAFLQMAATFTKLLSDDQVHLATPPKPSL
jgi:hypothetical protein